MRETVARNPNVHWTILEGEAVLVNLENGYFFTLNQVGATIWELLSEERTLDEVLMAICARYDVAEHSARADLMNFINMLNHEQLVEGGSIDVRGAQRGPAGS
ncbi:MAG TPA: PqqD family protein [Thermoanaerobaculia bacterium]|nr:PqqD family protein [Thermoanaerobaculia bacterium]